MQLVENQLDNFLIETKRIATAICSVLSAVDNKTITVNAGVATIDQFIAELNAAVGMDILLAPIKEFARQARVSLSGKLS
jgi:hypothetical protein